MYFYLLTCIRSVVEGIFGTSYKPIVLYQRKQYSVWHVQITVLYNKKNTLNTMQTVLSSTKETLPIRPYYLL